MAHASTRRAWICGCVCVSMCIIHVSRFPMICDTLKIIIIITSCCCRCFCCCRRFVCIFAYLNSADPCSQLFLFNILVTRSSSLSLTHRSVVFECNGSLQVYVGLTCTPFPRSTYAIHLRSCFVSFAHLYFCLLYESIFCCR